MERWNATDTNRNENMEPHIVGARLHENRDRLFPTTRHAKNAGLDTGNPLVSNFVLRQLPRDLVEFLRPSMKQVFLEKDQYVYQQDDPIENIYFPESAVISEYRMLEDGRTVEIAVIGNESAAGLSSLFGPCRAANSTQVSQAGSALKMESINLQKPIRSHPRLLALFHQHVDIYIRQISQRAICNMYHSVEERFCTWLLMLADRSKKNKLNLTHEQIARALGVYRPSVTCIALNMRKKNLISYTRGGISLKNRGAIEKLACDCYAELIANTTPVRANGFPKIG